ncbi:hypothetical protein BD410DRAFT_731203 [Rickenella mellea]|uniref:Uncharacterized protein n=1 Tax=Rickenella mellea TaxID=50990 RepID=A0A4Y7PMA2_9AGAM|nr:hypothetical protein BD410DRAFT_731203 [Rickenella mellea]
MLYSVKAPRQHSPHPTPSETSQNPPIQPPGQSNISEQILERLSGDQISEKFDSAVKDGMSPEIAIIEIMNKYNIDINDLHKTLSEKGLNVSFSKVKYKEIAHYVGLDHVKRFNDAVLFDLYRSRVPNVIFRSIVEDIDMLILQYGPLMDQANEEATSRTLSPIFNRLVAIFEHAIINEHESIIYGRLTTKGRIEYHFKTFGAVAILFVEVKHLIRSLNDKMDAIGQVIAECDACDWSNVSSNIHVPIYGILCDAVGFSFFRFNGSASKPDRFTGGYYPDGNTDTRRFSIIPIFPTVPKPLGFLISLRIITELVFDIMLAAYCESLVVFRDRSQAEVSRGRPRKSLANWEEAIKHAESARVKFRAAETKRKESLPDEADAICDEAYNDLKSRYNF